jgi:hypothetical protein
VVNQGFATTTVRASDIFLDFLMCFLDCATITMSASRCRPQLY